MNSSTNELRSRNLRTVFLLAALFMLPLAASFYLYYGAGWRPAGSANHGELIQPPQQLQPVSVAATEGSGSETVFEKQWTLVYVGDGACDQACRDSLYIMRQTRLLLNKDMGRVKRVFIATDNCCNHDFLRTEHLGLIVLDASTDAYRELPAHFPAQEREHTLFIVDPLGNVMMRYDARQNPKGLLEDLKRLLKLSHIG